jgi:hypothetical protein
MKPFDLEKAKAGEPAYDSNGKKYWFGAVVPNAKKSYQLSMVNDDFVVTSFALDGSFMDNEKSDYDLFMADPKPRRVAVYLNCYHFGGGRKATIRIPERQERHEGAAPCLNIINRARSARFEETLSREH